MTQASRRPPRLVGRLLELTLPGGTRGDSIKGDLDQEHRELGERFPHRSFRWWYTKHALALVLRYTPRRIAAVVPTVSRTDLRSALRVLIRQPRVSLIVVLTLTLGIGANTAVFSVLNAVVLRPLPHPQADRLVALFEGMPRADLPMMAVSAADFADYRREQQSFDDLAAFRNREFEFSMAGGDPERVTGAMVSAEVFPLLGVQPWAGRLFDPEENQPGRNLLAILSYEFWQRRFGGDIQVQGQTVYLDRTGVIVVGILPPGFSFPYRYRFAQWSSAPADVFVPIAFSAGELRARGGGYSNHAIGRLKPGVTLAQAQNDVQSIAQRIHDEYFPTSLRDAPNFELTATVRPLLAVVNESARLPLWLLMGAAVLVLVVAVVDVAGLLVARAVVREREMAVRLALGAGRGRLATVFLAESLALCFVGGVGGVLGSIWGTRILLGLLPLELPRVGEIGLNGDVVAFGAGLTLVSVLVFGLVPALRVWKPGAAGAIHAGRSDASFATRSGRLAHQGLVVVTVALAVILLVGTGVLLRSFLGLVQSDFGFTPDRVLTMRVPLPLQAYNDAGQIRTFYESLLLEVGSTPGVEVVGAANDLPLLGQENRTVWPEDDSALGDLAAPSATHSWVLGEYFAAVEIRLRSGRYFTDADRQGSAEVVIVNETLARRLWPGRPAVGQRLKFGTADTQAPWATVIGVVADVKDDGPELPARPHTYTPYLQAGEGWILSRTFSQLRALRLVVRTVQEPLLAVAGVRARVRALDEQLAVADIRTLERQLDNALAPRRSVVFLVAVFAAVALLLAAVGLYGVLSFSIARRTREIGVRIALGADRRWLFGMVFREGMVPMLLGFVVGLGGALALARLLSRQVYQLEGMDPVVLVLAGLLLTGVGSVACWMPARRAMFTDPVAALRAQ